MKRLILLGILLISLPLIFGVSFSSSPEFNNGNLVFTDEVLNCSWAYSGDTTTQNITVFREGAYFAGRNESGTPLNTSFVVSSVSTTKNEEWECIVRLNNATGTTTSSINATIQNSAPETPIIYNSTNDDIGTAYTVTEDTTYIFDVNSSDKDNDTLTYYFKSATQGFCTMPSPALGTASCTPTNSDHNGSNSSVNITFWVDDDDISFAKSASKTVTFTVVPSNDPPTAVTASQTTAVNTTLIYNIDATDEEGDSPLSFSLINTPAEISTKVSLVVVDNDTVQFVYNATPPDFNDVNTTGWFLTLNITDSKNVSGLVNFTLNITAVGRAPEIINFTPGPNGMSYTINQGDNLLINLTANDSDVNDTHTYLDNSVQNFFNTITLVADINITGNTTGQVNFTATNDDVGSFSVTITVRDIELINDTILLNFTVNNINDAPSIHELSNDTNNTNNNTNITNITSFAGAPLYFAVNASDIDIQYGDALNYSDNSTFFDINNDTGVISFTPNISDVQVAPYSINITVIDNASAQTSRIINFYILNNTAPYFTSTPPNQSCAEGILCTYNLSQYATDADAGDSVVSYNATTNLTSFSINETTGYINFTPNQTEIGNHSVQFIITDSHGATNSTNVTFEINNTEEASVLIRYNFSNVTIVETFLFIYQLQAQDNDLLANVSENLTFTTNLTFGNITSYTTGSNQTAATLSFTPNSSQVGNHSVNITVTDVTNLSNSQIFTFEILADSEPPVVELIQPYPNASNSSSPIESYNVTGQSNITSLTFIENNTYLFAHITTDDLTPISSLNTTWYYDGVQVATSWNYTRTFNFSSSGTHTLRLQINDTMLESTNFTWNLSITNLNRAPLLLNNLGNFTNITQPDTINFYFTKNISGNATTVPRFIDPDDDLNGNNLWDLGETNTLVFATQTCVSGSTTVANLTIDGPELTVTPLNIGNCTVTFTATDTSAVALLSNQVFINVTEQPPGSEETTTVTSSSGGGGSNTRSSFIPLTKETETPQAVNIIAPRLVTVYENNSIIIPFDVENTWTETLEYIQLGAGSNSSDVTVSLSSNIVESLEPNETAEIFLEVQNYRLGTNYEVEITANVSTPEFEDSAVVLLTSIEQSSKGDDIDIKVTFARDLFNENPECQELNELLDKANEELAAQNFEEAKRYVDTAINGCKYIVSTLKQRTERPDAISSIITLKEATLSTILFTALAFLIISTIAFIIYYHYTNKEEDDI